MNEKSNYYDQSRPEILSFISSGINSILDVGCGTGAFLRLVKERTKAETWGVEVIDKIAEKAKGQIDNIIIGKIEDKLESIPDSYFDCITLNDVLEHMIEPAKVLNSLKQKLSADGVIVASLPNVRYFFNLYELIISKDWKYTESGVLDSTHLRFFTKKSMKRLFDEAGYKITSQKGINKIASWKFQIFQFLTFGIFNDTKYLQYVCISKP
jgi:2-polyprenyl-3-methyl-5-hydroxy-6-metoxy-1,4-benzoquinol methylase